MIVLRRISYLIVSIILTLSIAFSLIPQYTFLKGQFVANIIALEIIGAILAFIAATLPSVIEISDQKSVPCKTRRNM